MESKLDTSCCQSNKTVRVWKRREKGKLVEFNQEWKGNGPVRVADGRREDGVGGNQRHSAQIRRVTWEGIKAWKDSVSALRTSGHLS